MAFQELSKNYLNILMEILFLHHYYLMLLNSYHYIPISCILALIHQSFVLSTCTMLISLIQPINSAKVLCIACFTFLSGDAVAFAGTGNVLFTKLYPSL